MGKKGFTQKPGRALSLWSKTTFILFIPPIARYNDNHVLNKGNIFKKGNIMNFYLPFETLAKMKNTAISNIVSAN